jgi:hypothetical protein
MDVKDYLDKVAFIGESEIPNDDSKIYYSNFDGSYLTRVGMEERVEILANLEITEELGSRDNGSVCTIGFSPKDNKWYGWSHRAIYGFTIGSTCKKGYVHYVPSNMDEYIEEAIRWYKDIYRENVRYKETLTHSGEKYIVIQWDYNDKVPNEELRGKTEKGYFLVSKFGRGEWEAKTMADAKQMVMEFSRAIG